MASTPPAGPGASEPIASPTPTPLFHAINSARYVRQDQIRRIEERTGRRLLCWVAEPHAEIDKYDIAPMGDLLHHVTDGEDVDLMLQTPGGDVDVAEKIVMMIRKRCGGLRVIVPEAAKSAGTFIAVAADQIVMGFASELGPIDPQVFITTPTGESMYRPAQSFLDGLAQIKTLRRTKALSLLRTSQSFSTLIRRFWTSARRPSTGRASSRRSGSTNTSAEAMA